MISLYLPGQSWAHRLPAGLKLVVLLLAGALVLPVDNIAVLSGLAVLVIAAYASLGREGLRQLRFLRPLAPILAALLAYHLVVGTALVGIVVVLRLLTMVLAANFVTITTRMDDMLEAIRPVFAPLRLAGISPQRPSLALTLILRFAPVLLSVYGMLQDAHQARTGRRVHWRLIAPFALHALRMSENVAEALTARGGADGLTSVPRKGVQTPRGGKRFDA